MRSRVDYCSTSRRTFLVEEPRESDASPGPESLTEEQKEERSALLQKLVSGLVFSRPSPYVANAVVPIQPLTGGAQATYSKEHWSVTLESVRPECRIAVVQVLRKRLDFGLQEAFKLVHDLEARHVLEESVVLREGISRADADEVSGWLQAAGAESRVL